MKYIKTYENLTTNRPEIGDYVVCKDDVDKHLNDSS